MIGFVLIDYIVCLFGFRLLFVILVIGCLVSLVITVACRCLGNCVVHCQVGLVCLLS